MSDPVKHVFVYGTLRMDGGMYKIMEGSTRYVGTYRHPGRIYSLGSFPGVLFTDPGVFSFVGELHEVKDGKILSRLDSYEGYHETSPENSLYLRKTIDVLTDKGPVPAYAYEYNGRIGASPIRSGDWLQRSNHQELNK